MFQLISFYYFTMVIAWGAIDVFSHLKNILKSRRVYPDWILEQSVCIWRLTREIENKMVAVML